MSTSTRSVSRSTLPSAASSRAPIIATRLNCFSRVATRHDKLLPNYEGFVQLAAVAILLR